MTKLTKIKQGNSTFLPVVFRGIELDQVASVELVVRQDERETGESVIQAEWINGQDGIVRRRSGENVLLLPVSAAQTYLLQRAHEFFLDVRIHPEGSDENPYSEAVKLYMAPTLFRQEGST